MKNLYPAGKTSVGLIVFRMHWIANSNLPKQVLVGRPKAALLFWFFGDFRCGALLFTVFHVIYKYKYR